MGGAMSRTKGQVGEREVASIIYDLLGIEVHRNWAEQSAHGGADLDGLDGFAIEVKRYKAVTPALINGWWKQAVAQAKRSDEVPVLWYRGDRQPWRVVLDGGWISSIALSGSKEIESWLFDYEYTMTISPEMFATMIREDMAWEQSQSSRH
jgi:hypothetical protein